jgi:hypothetical protein
MRLSLIFIIFICNVAYAADAADATAAFPETFLKSEGQSICLDRVRAITPQLILSGEHTGFAAIAPSPNKVNSKNLFDIFMKSKSQDFSAYSDIVGAQEPGNCQLVARRISVAPMQCEAALKTDAFKGSRATKEASGAFTLKDAENRIRGFLVGDAQYCGFVEVLTSGDPVIDKKQAKRAVDACGAIEKSLREQMITEGLEFPISGVDEGRIKANIVMQKGVLGSPEAFSYVVYANSNGSCDVALNRTTIVGKSCKGLRGSVKEFAGLKEKHVLKNGGALYGGTQGMDFLFDDLGASSCYISGSQTAFNVK